MEVHHISLVTTAHRQYPGLLMVCLDTKFGPAQAVGRLLLQLCNADSHVQQRRALAAVQCRQPCAAAQRCCQLAKGCFHEVVQLAPVHTLNPPDPPCCRRCSGGQPARGASAQAGIWLRWVRGCGDVAVKQSLTSPDTIHAEANINRRIPLNPEFAQVGALQHPASACMPQEGMWAACLSRGGTQLHLAGSSCVAWGGCAPAFVGTLHICLS